MCVICDEVAIPDWSHNEKREFVAAWEDIESNAVSDELIDEYEPLIELARVGAFYGVLVVPKEWRQEYIDQHCCIGKA